jgi:hypothetical protein
MKFAALLSLFAVLNGSTEATALTTEDTQLACYNYSYVSYYTYYYVGNVRYSRPVYATRWVCN